MSSEVVLLIEDVVISLNASMVIADPEDAEFNMFAVLLKDSAS